MNSIGRFLDFHATDGDLSRDPVPSKTPFAKRYNIPHSLFLCHISSLSRVFTRPQKCMRSAFVGERIVWVAFVISSRHCFPQMRHIRPFRLCLSHSILQYYDHTKHKRDAFQLILYRPKFCEELEFNGLIQQGTFISFMKFFQSDFTVHILF